MWGQLGLYILTFKFTALSISCSCRQRWWLSACICSGVYHYRIQHCYPIGGMDEQDQESRGTGCVRSEGVDTFEKLLASKNCCLQKGSEGSYVEELLPTAYLSIFSGLWKEFVTKAVAVDPHPILYQYVTNQAFEALIQETFQTSNVQQTSAEPLTYREEMHCGM